MGEDRATASVASLEAVPKLPCTAGSAALGPALHRDAQRQGGGGEDGRKQVRTHKQMCNVFLGTRGHCGPSWCLGIFTSHPQMPTYTTGLTLRVESAWRPTAGNTACSEQVRPRCGGVTWNAPSDTDPAAPGHPGGAQGGGESSQAGSSTSRVSSAVTQVAGLRTQPSFPAVHWESGYQLHGPGPALPPAEAGRGGWVAGDHAGEVPGARKSTSLGHWVFLNKKLSGDKIASGFHLCCHDLFQNIPLTLPPPSPMPYFTSCSQQPLGAASRDPPLLDRLGVASSCHCAPSPLSCSGQKPGLFPAATDPRTAGSPVLCTCLCPLWEWTCCPAHLPPGQPSANTCLLALELALGQVGLHLAQETGHQATHAATICAPSVCLEAGPRAGLTLEPGVCLSLPR